MSAQMKSPLIPASLAADGIQGAGASAGTNASGAEHTGTQQTDALSALTKSSLFAERGPASPAQLNGSDCPAATAAVESSSPGLSSGRCQCAGCGLYFTSEREFERHRVGRFAHRGMRANTRRCLSEAELATKGWKLSLGGFWRQRRSKSHWMANAAVSHTGEPEAQS